ncbi:uncharacterized protein K02A2.6-like [Ostrea edulis]|uniref:uncharacterized protein K02A2.6-like n=1 Tax=Ostrea edulis TaxID=37623 RepID=UPI0024AEBB70|nr:uncharacterized protein K02A2.6-like [Ostrea edulis]
MGLRFNPPESFNFGNPSEWPEWKQRFLRFQEATKLGKEAEGVQISTLIYVMGKEAEHVFKSFVFDDEEDAKKFAPVLMKFDDYFVPKRNIIHERAKFHQCRQNPGENVETFVRNLYEIAEHCDFKDRDDQIRDRIVLGILDRELSEKLQLTADLKLEGAIERARQSEMVKSQIKDQSLSHKHVKGVRKSTDGTSHNNHSQQQNRRRRGPPKNTRHPPSTNNSTDQFQSQSRCSKCNLRHNKDKCFAKGKQCRRCHDTGADTSVISEGTFRQLNHSGPLEKAEPLFGPGGRFQCLGKFDAETTHKDKHYFSPVHVIRGNSNLLGRCTASTMGLILKVNNVQINIPVFGSFGLVKCDPVKITLKRDYKPHCLTTARRVAFPLLTKVEAELRRLESEGIIEKVEKPTDWCSPVVPVVKKNGNLRICVDLKRLNDAVKREHYMLPNLDDIAPKLTGAQYFSKLDASSGFYQIPLDSDSCELTTFITPMGRYCFKSVPFGITSAPEIFQRKMTELLKNLKGTEVIIDDIIIYGTSKEEHDARLDSVLQTIYHSGLKLNREKCEFCKPEIEYFGHISVLRSDEDLLKTHIAWTWDYAQEEAFNRVKELLTNTPVLTFYDQSKLIVVCADASSYGLGAALFQEENGELKPIAYCSRKLTTAEERYAQIEKRVFSWTLGLSKVFTLLNTLSRSPVSSEDTKKSSIVEEIECYSVAVDSLRPISDRLLGKIRTALECDPILQEAMNYTRFGWPSHVTSVRNEPRDFFSSRGELSISQGLLLYRNRIVIPVHLRRETLEGIHEVHLGLNKYRARAQASVWWPGISNDIKSKVASCNFCQEHRPSQPREPLKTTPLPARPWQKIAADICDLDGKQYLIVTDYYSRFLEIAYLSNLTSSEVIVRVKNMFSRWGIPEELVSDNGRQFTSAEFHSFAERYHIVQTFSSPYYPQSNRAAENAVKIAKILRQDDIFLALMSYRATPIEATGMSPAEMLMGRKIGTLLPALPETLDPAWPETDDIRLRDALYKDRTKNSYDRHFNTRPLTEMEEGNQVRMKTDQEKAWSTTGTVRQCDYDNRSYVVETRECTAEIGDTCNLTMI